MTSRRFLIVLVLLAAAGALLFTLLTSPSSPRGLDETPTGTVPVDAATSRASSLSAARRVEEERAQAAEEQPPAPADVGLEPTEPLPREEEPQRTLALLVLDAVDGRHLEDVTVRSRGPGRLCHHVPSPVRLPLPKSVLEQRRPVLQVEAVGYVTRSYPLDLRAGWEHTVRLERAGSLSILVQGGPVPADAVLRLWPAGQEGTGRPTRTRPLAKEAAPDRKSFRIELESVPPQPQVAQIQLGSWYEDPLVLADASFDLAAGERKEIVLTIDRTRIPQPARLAGILVLPSAWSETYDALHVQRVGNSLPGRATDRLLPIAEMERIGEGEYRWDAGTVLTGRYALEVQDPRFVTVVEVPLEGEERALVEVPPPATLTVEVVDSRTGASLPDARLSWRTIWPDGVGRAWESAAPDPETGLFDLLAPVGEVELAVNAHRYQHRGERVPLQRDGSFHRLHAEASYLLSLQLFDGNERVPLPGGLPSLADKLEHLDGDGGYFGYAVESGKHYLLLDQPGRYRVTLPRIPGYRPIPDPVVEVDEKLQPLRIDLVRE